MLLNFDSLITKYNLKINGIIHIGAHYGQEHKIYKKHKVDNIIYFEPLNKNLQVLKNNVGNEAIIMEYALGDENKIVEMFVESSNSGQSCSILEPHLHLTQYPHIIFNEKQSVQMKRLDDIDFDKSKYNMIIIDVQGYELEVFKGSENFLNNVDYIMSEINRDEVYLNCVKITQLEEFLSKYGFKLVEENWEGGTWGDGFFVKISK